MAWLLLVLAVSAGVVDRVAAVVDGEVIALSEVYEMGGPYIAERCPGRQPRCVYDMEMEVLDALIRRVLIRHELDELDLQVKGKDIDQAIDGVVRDNGLPDRAALREEIERQGLEWDTFRSDLADRLRVQRFQQAVLVPRVVVRDDEVRDVYKRTERSSRAEQVTLDAFGVILPADADEQAIADEVAAIEQVVADLREGRADWEQVAAERDDAQLASVVGGRAYERGQLHEAVDEAAFSAEVGEVVGPIRVGRVLFVIRVRERGLGPPRVVPFEEVEEQLRNQLFQDKLQQAEDEWYQRARRLAAVEIKLPEPED